MQHSNVRISWQILLNMSVLDSLLPLTIVSENTLLG
jgi:hypothetical protein